MSLRLFKSVYTPLLQSPTEQEKVYNVKRTKILITDKNKFQVQNELFINLLALLTDVIVNFWEYDFCELISFS